MTALGTVQRWPAVLAMTALLCVAVPAAGAAADEHPSECDRVCLSHLMGEYLDHALKQHAAGSVWEDAARVAARQDFPDSSSGNIYSLITLRRKDGRVLEVSARLKVQGREIAEREVLGGVASAGAPAGMPPIAPEHRASRTQLIRIANGYFEALGTRDPGAARLGPTCVRHEDGRDASCAAGLAEGTGQQVIERRFPVALPELGVVIGYGFVMHHERTPPEDEFMEVLFRIEDGRITAMRARRHSVMAPGRSGFSADFPDPGILRDQPPRPREPDVISTAPPPHHFRGYNRLQAFLAHLRRLLAGGTWREPPARVLKPPYAGIAEARDLPYGPDAKQRLDILSPTAMSGPRTVLMFFHGGAWEGGTKHFDNDILYENVVLWAAQHGMVGVNVDYRLADYQTLRNLYPSQEQDVAAAVDWVGAHIAGYGGDPNRIFLWGHSAGGSSIAGYVSNPALYGRTAGVKGIFLLSAPLDPTIEERAGQPIRYFGTTHQQFAERAPLRTLLKSDIPVLFGYSPEETDMAPELESARLRLCAAGRCPHFVLTKGTHDGEMRAVGTAESSATDALLAFMAGIR